MRAGIALLCAPLILCAPSGFAEEVSSFPEFKAKRVKPPSSGKVGKLITVQIDPNEQPATLPPITKKKDAVVAEAAPQAPRTRYDWFWDKVSADLEQANAGRIEAALIALNGPDQQVASPRLQDLSAIVAKSGVEILLNTIGTDVSPALVLAVIAIESAGKSDAVSHAGAQGLMQLMPATAARFGVTDSFEPAQNIAGGVKYLDWLMKEFDRDPIFALAGYNAGEGAVRKHKGVPPFAETRDYVPKVLAAYNVAKGLCKTPPQFASDACVFNMVN
ncbi:MAG: lytic transglycosylase domain-containing protein [Pseudomonadota bacterium]